MIVMGTALAVTPFNMLVDSAKKGVHQVLVNRENTKAHGYDFVNGGLNRMFMPGNCDDSVWKVCKELGWEEALKGLIEEYQKKKGAKL